MNDSTVAAKLLAQLRAFLGRFSPHFHKPVARFIGDMLYGIVASKDVKLSSIVRALREKTSPKKVEDRLSRMLSSKGLEEGLHDFIASEGARKVRADTLIIIDPSDVQKPYARKMDYLAKVWDGSRGEVGDNLGYWGCMAVACESGGRRPVPLHFRLWSADSPGFTCEGDEVGKAVDAIARHTKRRGTYVYDRGGGATASSSTSPCFRGTSTSSSGSRSGSSAAGSAASRAGSWPCSAGCSTGRP